MIAQRFPNGTERRGGVEIRAAAGRRLEGYAATFGTPGTKVILAPSIAFTETIRAGAFTASLANEGIDVLALVDHDPSRLLARRSSGSLRLAEDGRGLAFAIELPDTALARDILALAERGDIGGMSFGFIANRDEWPAPDRRDLVAVTLLEISVVQAWPAYGETSVIARSHLPKTLTPGYRRLILDSAR